MHLGFALSAGRTPKCSAGSYRIAKDTIELLQGPERTVSELKRLRQILRVARESGASPEEVRSTLQRELPDLGQRLVKLLVPETPEAFWALVGVVLMVVGMILSAKQAGQTVNIEAEQVINNIVVQEAPPLPAQPTVEPSTNPAYGKKVGRNKPCPCESGKKFKYCHGKNGETRYYGP